MSRFTKLSSSTILGSAAFALITSVASATANAEDINNLLSLSLEQLSNIEVTSVSKRSEKASEAAAAIYVITQEDIRRSGHTSIPELLRMVPGLSVARSNSNGYAITARGTSSQFANKLLVLIDGRTVYTPLFSGVYWDAQDTMLSDIDRIEVIRGPGATLWGANAVNGVINIITKHAKDTQGGLASQTFGNIDRSLTNVRYGAKISDEAYARVYAKYDDRDELHNAAGGGAVDPWNKSQTGFRMDGNHNDITYTLQGDAYRAGENYPRALPTLAAPNMIRDREIVTGGNVLGRASYKQSATSEWTWQMYFDNAQRKSLNLYNLKTNTLDVELQNAWTPSDRHEIIWGAGYRFVANDSRGSLYLYLAPPSRNDNLFNAFVQDKITLVPDNFFLTLGSKFERNDYTGFETQPSARLTWLIDSRQTWWSSVSHAVRTPNRFSDNGSIIVASIPATAYFATAPNETALSEKLNAFETGYRIQPTTNLSFDMAAFYNSYSRLITSAVGAFSLVNIPGVGLTPIVPITPVNGNSGTTKGVELAANWEVTPIWKLGASYTYLNFTLDNPELSGFTVQGTSPKNQANLRSSLNLPHNFELDNALYYVDKLPGAGIKAYTRVDARLGWHPMDGVEVSAVGQNLFHRDHAEFTPFVYQSAAQVPRAYYGNITLKF